MQTPALWLTDDDHMSEKALRTQDWSNFAKEL